MTSSIVIRDETPVDAGAITDVTRAAFSTLEVSRHTEQFIVEALRAARALTESLVAEEDGRIVGHVAFSPVTVSDGTPGWYGLGPVSVLPERQGRGIGGALIREGLERLKARGAAGCCLVGHPEYYRRFGFENAPGLGLEGVPPEVFFALAFSGPLPRGAVAFHDAFAAAGEADGSSGA
ncbi:MAG TPA: N-acetyltransferase [bacterium]|nr:N-acetyltransferase [bacterium]HPJ71239.1 N-acetyltransferase [bacterium]HPQ67347.1 N-acetyltransferase [bacterium]